MRHTLASAHAVLTVEGGVFRSAIESPELVCQDGLWPVLVGEPGTKMLASPIILPDYPQVAPESPGDFFDGCEIDQLLVLNILALTDEEKAEIRAGDPRARAILERTEATAPEDLMRLHGTWREP
jgi:hydrogenase maturation protease